MNRYTSMMIKATVRVAGETPFDIGVSHLGAPEQEASLRTGEPLIYPRDPGVALSVVHAWRQSRCLIGNLPHIATASRLHLPPRVGLVGVVVRLGGSPFCGGSWVPAQPGMAEPAPHPRRSRTHRLRCLVGLPGSAGSVDQLPRGRT